MVAGHLLDPLRLEVGNAAAKQACGFDQLGRDDPAAGLFAQLSAGVAVKLDAAGAQVGLVIANVQETGVKPNGDGLDPIT